MFNSRRYSGINRVNTHTLVLLSFGSTSYGTETGGATTKTKKNEELVGETFFPTFVMSERDSAFLNFHLDPIPPSVKCVEPV